MVSSSRRFDFLSSNLCSYIALYPLQGIDNWANCHKRYFAMLNDVLTHVLKLKIVLETPVVSQSKGFRLPTLKSS